MFTDRISYYKQIEKDRNSNLLVYITGDRQGLQTVIHPEVHDFFVHHLDKFSDNGKITLFLYTRGGSTAAAWSLANLIRQFCDEFEVIIPMRAHSAGTLLSLGADRLIMTKQATLGPIDPSVNGPLNPQIPGSPAGKTLPVSVEAIQGFMEFVDEEIKRKDSKIDIVNTLTGHIHPLVLGEAYRARGQIRMLAGKLLQGQVGDNLKIDAILDFLCSESGSHDYTINRSEAENDLRLSIEKPDQEFYELIMKIHDSISEELLLTSPYDPNVTLGADQEKDYEYRRALVESLETGTHVFVSKGKLLRQRVQIPPNTIEERIVDQRTFDGWRFEDAPDE